MRWFRKPNKDKKTDDTSYSNKDNIRRRDIGNKTDTARRPKRNSMRNSYIHDQYDISEDERSYRLNTPPSPNCSNYTITTLSSLLMKPPPLKEESSRSLLSEFLVLLSDHSGRQPPSPSPPAASPSLYSYSVQKKEPYHHSDYDDAIEKIKRPISQPQREPKLSSQPKKLPQSHKITKSRTVATSTSAITRVPLNTNEERQSKFDALEFTWKLINHAEWYSRYEELEKYKQRHGHIYVPLHYIDNPMLGRWVYRQKELYQKYKEDQITSYKQNDVRGIDRKSTGSTGSVRSSSSSSSSRRGILKDRRNLNHYEQKGAIEVMKEKGNELKRHVSVGELTDEKARKLERLGFEYNGVNVF